MVLVTQPWQNLYLYFTILCAKGEAREGEGGGGGEVVRDEGPITTLLRFHLLLLGCY